MAKTYSLFWREERGDYDLRHGDEVLCRLPDTEAAQLVLRALSEQKELRDAKDTLRAIGHYAREIVSLVDKVPHG